MAAVWTRIERQSVRRRGRRFVFRKVIVRAHTWGPKVADFRFVVHPELAEFAPKVDEGGL